MAMAAGVDSLNAGCWTATVWLLVSQYHPLPLVRYSRRRSDCCIALCASIVLLSRRGGRSMVDGLTEHRGGRDVVARAEPAEADRSQPINFPA